jgi:hypothetical protein
MEVKVTDKQARVVKMIEANLSIQYDGVTPVSVWIGKHMADSKTAAKISRDMRSGTRGDSFGKDVDVIDQDYFGLVPHLFG